MNFVVSSYADYLFYLFYRSTGNFDRLESQVPLGDIPELDELISLQEQAASARIASYDGLYPLVARYRDAKTAVVKVDDGGKAQFVKMTYSLTLPAYPVLEGIVKRGQAQYPCFLKFWESEIAPAERAQIAAWKTQLKQCAPLDKLQELQRLPFPFPELDVAAIALHLAGSANTHPAGVYTKLFDKPNLAAVLGHEATHLMVDPYAGHNWKAHASAEQAIALVEKRGGKASDIEESLSLFMQMKLSQTCGYTEASRRMSDRFPAEKPTGAILRSLESGWSAYEADPDQNIIDYLLARTIAAFPQSP